MSTSERREQPDGPIVDHQAHWFPRTYVESLLDRDRFPRASLGEGGAIVLETTVDIRNTLKPSYLDLDVHLSDLADHGIDIAVISPALLGEVAHLPTEDAVRALDAVNQELSHAQCEYSDHVAGLGMMPMQDPDAALQVLNRAIVEMGLKGVCVLSNIGGKPIVSDGLLPVYRRIEELGVPLYLHPAWNSMAHGAGLGLTIELGIGWMFDTAAAALALVYGGVLDACPNLTVVHPHLGGDLPYVSGRMNEVGLEFRVDVRHDLLTYLRERFYVDCVQSTPAALALAADIYGWDRIVYATDYPWVDRGQSREYVEENLDDDHLEQVLCRNAVPGLALPS